MEKKSNVGRKVRITENYRNARAEYIGQTGIVKKEGSNIWVITMPDGNELHPQAPGPNPWERNGKLPHEDGIKKTIPATHMGIPVDPSENRRGAFQRIAASITPERRAELTAEYEQRLRDSINEADILLKEIYEHIDKHYPEQSHGLKGKIGEYLIKYNIQ